MDSRTSVHVIKTACRVVVAVFVRPAALFGSVLSRSNHPAKVRQTSEPREQGRVRVLCGSTQFPDAMAQLGYFLTVGTGEGGTAPNPKEGVAALRAAADWGNSAGQVMYGRVLERGYGFCDIKECEWCP
ncbi:hypothetical protein Pelo_19891 [Pelomyxa schiedti]|nr:hypothetical protein Pelo_19891 [Pelomyxa schiedti]